MQKLLFICLAMAVNFAIQWYAHGAGKIPTTGALLNWHYDSAFVGSAIQTLKYAWFFILANMFFTYAFKIGESSFDTFLIAMIIWIASAPLATLLYNTIVLKNSVNWLHLTGIVLVVLGSICVAANQELLDVIKK